MKIQPVADRVLVRIEAAKYAGTLVLPEATRGTMGRGVVEAVGPGRLAPAVLYIEPSELTEDLVHLAAAHRDRIASGERVPMEVSVGDTVIFPITAGTPLEVDRPATAETEDPDRQGGLGTVKTRYVLLRHDDLLAVLSGEGDVYQRPPEPGEPLPGT